MQVPLHKTLALHLRIKAVITSKFWFKILILKVELLAIQIQNVLNSFRVSRRNLIEFHLDISSLMFFRALTDLRLGVFALNYFF